MTKRAEEKEFLKPLLGSFKIEDKRPERQYWIVTCKACGQRWSLGTDSRHGGNILALINHKASHLDEKGGA